MEGVVVAAARGGGGRGEERGDGGEGEEEGEEGVEEEVMGWGGEVGGEGVGGEGEEGGGDAVEGDGEGEGKGAVVEGEAADTGDEADGVEPADTATAHQAQPEHLHSHSSVHASINPFFFNINSRKFFLRIVALEK